MKFGKVDGEFTNWHSFASGTKLRPRDSICAQRGGWPPRILSFGAWANNGSAPAAAKIPTTNPNRKSALIFVLIRCRHLHWQYAQSQPWGVHFQWLLGRARKQSHASFRRSEESTAWQFRITTLMHSRVSSL